jgi:hypothetical protein
MEFTPEKIAELRALAEKSTPRPWVFYNGYPRVDDPNFHNFNYLGLDDVAVIEARERYMDIDLTIREADADYLHEATSTLPAALDEIERLQIRIIELTEMANAAYTPYRERVNDLLDALKKANDENENIKNAIINGSAKAAIVIHDSMVLVHAIIPSQKISVKLAEIIAKEITHEMSIASHG